MDESPLAAWWELSLPLAQYPPPESEVHSDCRGGGQEKRFTSEGENAT